MPTSRTADISVTASTSLSRNFVQPGCGSNNRWLRSFQNSSPAFRQAPRLIARARPACLSGPTSARLNSWVQTRVKIAIFTGVRIFCCA
ncbi:hypothetical protein D3C81_1402140 [compost metagenome]